MGPRSSTTTPLRRALGRPWCILALLGAGGCAPVTARPPDAVVREPAAAAPAKTQFCRSTVTIRDVERCVGELTAAEQQRREFAYALRFEQGHPIRREMRTGYGQLTENDCAVARFTYDGNRLTDSYCSDE